MRAGPRVALWSGCTPTPMGTSTKLTAETFPDFVEDALVDEKTAIVRFIAGEG